MYNRLNSNAVKIKGSYIGSSILSNAGINLAFSFIFALLMAISANSFIYLPFTPVPITTQVLTVLLSGLFLGSRWAFASQVIYILMGLMGLPVFSGFKNGIIALAGPTGGYIIGFMAAAFIVGYIYENSEKNSGSGPVSLITCAISCITGVILIHLFGFIHLASYFYILQGAGSVYGTLIKTWQLGTRPFLIIDLLKIIFAVIIINLKVKNEKNKNK
ncbi:MAG: biotin transporter BioY [Actinomycetota bacterium]|nr:biotin transporter BioY [Actinomycetota bacterium]